MGFPKGQELTFKYEYDFAVSGGAVSSIALVNKGINALEAGLIITDFIMHIETAFDGTATPVLLLGNAGDVDGYSVDFYAKTSVLNLGELAGALVWDNANDAALYYKIGSAADAIPRLDISVQALTAGKFTVYFKAMRP